MKNVKKDKKKNVKKYEDEKIFEKIWKKKHETMRKIWKNVKKIIVPKKGEIKNQHLKRWKYKNEKMKGEK